MKSRRAIVLTTTCVVFLCALVAGPAGTQTIPSTISYSGRITGAGAPITGNLDLTFRFYDQKTGGGLLWVEQHPAVPVDNGKFNVELGSINPFASTMDPVTCPGCPLLFDEAYFMSLEVNGDGEMAPRLPLTSVGYSLNAIRSESAKNSDRAAKADTVKDGSITLSSLDPTMCLPGEVMRMSETDPSHWECNLAVGPQGPPGEKGDTGDTGATGSQGVGLGDIVGMAIVIRGFRDGAPVNGTTVFDDPIAAIAAADDWCGTPSPANLCLLKIGPGRFFLDDTLTMRPFVDIEGSGEGVTFLQFDAGYSIAAVRGAANAEIRHLTIRNSDGPGIVNTYSGSGSITSVHIEANQYGITNHDSSPLITDVSITSAAVGIRNSQASPIFRDVVINATEVGIENNQSSPIISDVSVTVSREPLDPFGIGVHNYNSSAPVMSNVTVQITRGYGLYIDGAFTSLTNSTITVDEGIGVRNWNGSVATMRNVSIHGDFYGGVDNNDSEIEISGLDISTANLTDPVTGVQNGNSGLVWIDHSSIITNSNSSSFAVHTSSSGILNIGNTKIWGEIGGSGTPRCAGVYDRTYTELSPICGY